LRLLGGFELRIDDKAVAVPISTRRVVAFLALRDRPVNRGYVAGNLWLDKNDQRANANLRSALWRLPRTDGDIVLTKGSDVWLSDSVAVDIRQMTALARQGPTEDDVEVDVPSGALLPDWTDDWLVLERERLRQLQLSALEGRSDRLVGRGKIALAVDTAWSAIAIEPLRESSHRCLVRAHLAGGNAVEALRHYRFFANHLANEIGLTPSPAMEVLVAALLTDATRP
jgi:DNA-binding SARP family transcriptional activator